MLSGAAGNREQIQVRMNVPQGSQSGEKGVFLSREDKGDVGRFMLLNIVLNDDSVVSSDSGAPRKWTQKDSSVVQYVMAKAMYGTKSPGSFWSNLFYGVAANQRVAVEESPNFLNGVEDYEISAEQRFSRNQSQEFGNLSVKDHADMFDHGIEPAHLTRLMQSIRHIDVSSVAGNAPGSEAAGKA